MGPRRPHPLCPRSLTPWARAPGGQRQGARRVRPGQVIVPLMCLVAAISPGAPADAAPALPGPHTVEATGESSGRSAQATFDVRTDWAKFHSDDANSGYNRLENVLSPSNVGSLQEAWSFQVSLALEGSPVVAGGLLYVGSEDGNVYALDPTTGTQRWVFTS